MRERPIIFNARDVRAILDGKKTQTRAATICYPGDRLWVREAWRIGAWDEDNRAFAIDYIDGPDRKWRTDPTDKDGSQFNNIWLQCYDELAAKGIHHDADGNYHWVPGASPLRWRSQVAMPRWASRILLEITEVRVQQLQDMDEGDAIAEGWHHGVWGDLPHVGNGGPFDWFASVWDSTAKDGARWKDNPWVWAVSFKRVQP